MNRQLIAAFLFFASFASGQINVNVLPVANNSGFPLVAGKNTAGIYFNKSDQEVVKMASTLFVDDVDRVTGKKPKVYSDLKFRSKTIVLIGTLGHNERIDELIKAHKIDVSSIRDGWERFIIKTVENPFPGVSKGLVIVGSDRRGTAYGVFTLSESIGVSPWYWWADVSVKKKSNLFIQSVEYVSSKPSVKYRGIFLNDEDWGLKPWASKTDDPKLNDIGPKTYARICELLLRLKANFLCPAMHECSGAFNSHPENKIVADSYGIIMGSSHCEPLLFNNAKEWDKKTMGEWNYLKNKEGINKVLDKRISENAPYENIYTIAMRGIHDAAMVGVPKEKEVEVLEEAIKDQRSILGKHIKKPIDSIPQIFVPYKEVLDIYERGLKVPDDVTIVWPDDNFGYIKRLSNSEEQKRSGGSGVYYHISYLGEPHDYLWLYSTPPALMYEELRKAYDTGADRYWLVNVGDIKPGEYGIQLFMDMAWDITKFNFANINEHRDNWMSSIFGAERKEAIKDITNSYFHLAFQRKPEAMGWGFEWNNKNSKERITDTEFSFVNYNEAEGRIQEYERIAQKATDILTTLPKTLQPAFYELVYYPVKGASLMNKKMLIAQQNRWYARQGRSATNQLAMEVQLISDSIDRITKGYNTLLNSKWNNMMSVPPGITASYEEMPPVEKITLPEGAGMKLFLPGEDGTFGISNIHSLPCFNPYVKKEYFVEIYNTGTNPIIWKASCSQNWIKLSKGEGQTRMQERVVISVDWNKAPIGINTTGKIEFISGSTKEQVFVSLFNPEVPRAEDLKGLFVEDNGCVSINAGDYQRKKENKDVKIETINGLGYENQCVQLGKAINPSQDTWSLDGPKAEYDFYTFNAGSATVYTYALPLFARDSKHDTRYGVMVDDGMIHRATTASKEYSGSWSENVIRNCVINVSHVTIGKPGKHTLKIFCIDPGVVIQKIVIDLGGMKKTYTGPEVTKMVQ